MKLKTTFLLFFIATLTNYLSAQSIVKMTSNYGSENQEIQDIIDFENIYIEKLNFESANLKGRSFVINIEEYENGKLTNISQLFDGTEDEYFKIKTEKESLKFFFKMTDGKLKAYVRGNRFGTKKLYINLLSDSDKYVLKDFFGREKELNIDLNKKNIVFAIVTPTIHEDGSGSYCEVAHSNIEPEKWGEHFKIPHYFLVTITFK